MRMMLLRSWHSLNIFILCLLSCRTIDAFHPGFVKRKACVSLYAVGPRGDARRARQRRRSPETTTRTPRRPPFDAKTLVSQQSPNEQADPYDCLDLTCMDGNEVGPPIPEQPAFEFVSLDKLGIAGFSELFNTNQDFRNMLRTAMREDIYDSTPQYQGLSQKARDMLLLPDSSLQGSWRTTSTPKERMKRLTNVLQDAFGGDSPSGDDLMHAVGSLCGTNPITHWMDIVGVLDRGVPHSWHQDTGRSADSKTVLWGFPPEDHYQGCGVFSRVVSLKKESVCQDGHPPMQPILFRGTVPEEYIVRPSYGKGRELLVYRDVDVLHSSPDVAYRTSVMRFM